MIKKWWSKLKNKLGLNYTRLKEYGEKADEFQKNLEIFIQEYKNRSTEIELDITEYVINGYSLKLGDKVILRLNSVQPLIVGELIEFWEPEKGKKRVPVIKDENGETWSTSGIIRPYSDKLYDKLINLKPLEQWNELVDNEQFRYTKEEMIKKERIYNDRLNGNGPIKYMSKYKKLLETKCDKNLK